MYTYIYIYNHIAHIPLQYSMQILKTITNSWSTSYRYHETVKHKCLFGCASHQLVSPKCNPIDCLSHYICCERLWRILRDIFRSDLPLSSAARLGLIAGQFHAPAIVVAFGIYHFFKVGNMHLVRGCSSRLDLQQVYDAAYRFGKSLADEPGVVRLNNRASSLIST